MTPEPVTNLLGLVQNVLERQPEQGGDHRQQGDEQVVAGVAQGDPGGEAGQERGGAQELLADHVGHHGREHDGEDGLDGELPQDDLDPEEHARDGGVEGGRDTAGGATGDQHPQPALGHPDQLAQARGQRRADLHDRPSRPTEPPAPMHRADAVALTTATWGRMRPPCSATATITSGTPWPRASRAKR